MNLILLESQLEEKSKELAAAATAQEELKSSHEAELAAMTERCQAAEAERERVTREMGAEIKDLRKEALGQLPSKYYSSL